MNILDNGLKLKLLKRDGNRSIFENPDADLKGKIQAIERPDTFFRGIPVKEYKVQEELGDGQFLCKSEDGSFLVIKKDDLDRELNEALLTKINQEFDIADYADKILPSIADELLVISWVRTTRGLQFKWEGLYLGEDEHSFYVQDIVDYFGGPRGEIIFTISGDISFWNYDFDLEEWQNKSDFSKINSSTIMDFLNEFIDEGEYQRAENRFFNEKHCFVIKEEIDPDEDNKHFVVINRFVHTNDGKYETRIFGKTKRISIPKKTTKANKTDIVSIVAKVVQKITWLPGDLNNWIVEDNNQTKHVEVEQFNANDFKNAVVWDFWDEKDNFIDEYEEFDENKVNELCEKISKGEGVQNNSDELFLEVNFILKEFDDFPNFSFNKGEKQKNYDKFVGLVKMPHGCNFSFEVEEGDAVELTRHHSVYETDIVGWKFVGIENPKKK